MLFGAMLCACFALSAKTVRAQEKSESNVATAEDTEDAGEAADAGDAGDAAEGAVAASDHAVNECSAEDDFPTAAVADYVLGCMAANGNSYQALQQCSCSIDFIKARMSYKQYEQAGTVLQVQQDIGQRGIFYRDSHWAKDRIEKLEDLQAESTLLCF